MWAPHLVTFPWASKDCSLRWIWGERTHPAYTLTLSSNPFFCTDNFSQSASLELQMFKHKRAPQEWSSFPYYPEDLGKHESLPFPWQIASATVCFPFVPIIWEQERNEYLLKTEFMTTREQPPSARLMNAWVSVFLPAPTLLDVLSMCVMSEGGSGLWLFCATGSSHYGEKWRQTFSLLSWHGATSVLQSSSLWKGRKIDLLGKD